MKKYKYILTSLVLGMLFTACRDGGEEVPGPGEGRAESSAISLGAGYTPATGNGTVAWSRAAAGFPNDGRIGVVAAYDEAIMDWRSYDEIMNAPATAETVNSVTYSFKWDNVRYWPFDGRDIRFLAYSPYDGESTAVELDYDMTILWLKLQEDMPEVMYASNNTAGNIYNKTSGTVDLGDFRQAMSKVTVIIEADPLLGAGERVKISSLTINTTKADAYLDLLDGDSGPKTIADSDFTYNLSASAGGFSSTNPVSETVLLYPGTQDYTTVDITLSDGTFSLQRSYPISAFVNTVDDTLPVTFEMGKNAVLRFMISGTPVDQPNDSVTLQGQIVGWNERGEFGVTIN